MIAPEGIALECFNCGSVTYVSFDLPDPLPPVGSMTELAVTCELCNRTQWMTLTMKARAES
jgi:hypothetical protein